MMNNKGINGEMRVIINNNINNNIVINNNLIRNNVKIIIKG